jgi:hypothetical protein
MATDFVFVGYLVQEPYLHNWPRREGLTVATIERDVHPESKREWEEIDGVLNSTEFHTKLPLEPEAGWVLNGYAIERSAIEEVVWSKTKREGMFEAVQTFKYALHGKRADDSLAVLGYELVDCHIERLSVLNNCGYTMEQIRKVAGDLNEFSLFSDPGQAQAFQKYVVQHGGSHACTAIFEVLGKKP